MSASLLWLSLVTFSEVRPILQERCHQCHRERRWDWTNYDTAFLYRDKIKFAVWTNRTMPLANVTRMTEAERVKIKNWVDNGAKK